MKARDTFFGTIFYSVVALIGEAQQFEPVLTHVCAAC